MSSHSRRMFLGTASALALGGANAFAAPQKRRKNPVCVFTKPFNSLSYDQLAKEISGLGFDGIEAPIRKGGHVAPEAIPDELPKLVDALTSHNLALTMMTSDINNPNAPLTEPTLNVAAELGVKFYRMKYFKYDESRPIPPQITSIKSQLKDLAAMNKQLGITGLYQNHAGRNYFGAALWDLHMGLDGIDPTEIGVAYDIRHATVEGGMSWPTTFQLIRPHVSAVYVKDFVWNDGVKPENVPLGEGRVDRSFFKALAKTDFSGPISLHEEYLDHRKPELVPDHLAAMGRDLKQLDEWL